MKTYDPLNTSRIEEFYFDEDSANLVIEFFEKYLVHIKGSQFANKAFKLQAWQKKMLRDIFGWKNKADNTRRFREAYIEIPRKNGKSSLCAGIALFLLFADKEDGAEIYSAAADKSQAAIVFDVAKEMVQRQKNLKENSQIFRSSIVYPKKASSYKTLSADAYTKHGFNAHGIIFDELHAQPDRELYDVLSTSTGSRLNPLMISITTAGYDRTSICWEKHEYAQSIINNIIDDPTFYPLIFALSTEDDWTDPKKWKDANPNMGISISEEYLKKECNKAKEIPAYENTFKRLHLNIWTEQATRWIPMDKWELCHKNNYKLEDFAGYQATIGIDLSSTTDLSSIVAIVEKEKEIILFPHFYLPKDNIDGRTREDKVPFELWAKQGFLTLTDGNIIDYNFIKNNILNICKILNVYEVGYDPYNSSQFIVDLQAEGIRCVDVQQSFKVLNDPSKQFMNLILSQNLEHQNNPLLNWMAANTNVKTDSQNNIKPVKSKANLRIDGIIAAIIGLERFTKKPKITSKSVYEEEDFDPNLAVI